MIIPIVTPNIDFSKFLFVVNNLFNCSIVEQLDIEHVPPQTSLAYLLQLDQFKNLMYDKYDVDWKALFQRHLLSQLSYTFLVGLSDLDLQDLTQNTELWIISQESTRERNKHICICQGSLWEWKQVIIYCCFTNIKTLHLLAESLYSWFKNNSLEKVFSDYNIVQCDNVNGLKIEHKK